MIGRDPNVRDRRVCGGNDHHPMSTFHDYDCSCAGSASSSGVPVTVDRAPTAAAGTAAASLTLAWWGYRWFGDLIERLAVMSLDAVALREVMPSTKQLHIGGRQRGTTFSEWKDVVEVQFVDGTAH